MEDRDLEVDERFSLFGFKSPVVKPPKVFVPQKSLSGAHNGRIMILDETVLCILKPLKRTAESGFDVHWVCRRPERGFNDRVPLLQHFLSGEWVCSSSWCG